ncbi:MAG: molybdenum cofactor biosynthesis protein MoaE [Cytophagaceae bacterium]|nr:molybdenum cofactor biosynthesis protein MoaE [Cytophagaceae bacterium]MDW8456505.1 molybdenum cofactor biosynthesis protein MoaE [Cytophagaceae bacterium]
MLFIQGAISADFIMRQIEKIQSESNPGAYSLFAGQVRPDVHEKGTVMGIDYTAYEKMAEHKAEELRSLITEKHNLTSVCIYHSIGFVKAGEISLVVITASKHRKAAIEGCSELVELIKTELPVWGREVYDDNQYKWKENNP